MKRFAFVVFAFLLLSISIGGVTTAFDSIGWSQIHQEITTDALGGFLKPEVLEKIVDGNDFFYDFTRFPFSDVHFDDCNFSGSIKNINNLYNSLVTYVLEGDERTEETFGHLLHPVQDFYAHSNWVESGFTNRLFESSDGYWFGGSAPEPFTPIGDFVLIQGEDDDVPSNIVLHRDVGHKNVNVRDLSSGFAYYGILTGYFTSFTSDDCPDSVAIGHYDHSDETGLNKDDPERTGFNEAYALAVLQTKQEWCRLVKLSMKEDGVHAAANLMVKWVQSDKMQEALTNCQGLKIDVDSSVAELIDLVTGKLDTTNKTKPLDLVFVIDTTQSMEDDIGEAKIHAQDIINQVAKSGLDWQLALVTYRDYPDGQHGETTDYQSRIELGFSTDAGTISSAINAIVVAGGADGPESVYSGLMDAMSLDWRNGAQKVVVLLGDAPPQDPEPGTGYTKETVLTRAFNLDPVNVYPILISNDGEARRAFASLADGTSGRIFNANTAQDVVSTLITTIETATGDTHLTVGGYARVFTTNDDLLNLREGTNTSTTVLRRMPPGTVLKIVGGPEYVYPYIWWQVQNPEGIVGYSVEAADGVVTLVNVPKEQEPALATMTTCVGTPSTAVTIHQTANVSGKNIGTLVESTQFVASHKSGKYIWYKLATGGWVHGDFVALSGNCTALSNE